MARSDGKGAVEHSNSVFVHNLGFGVEEERIRELFRESGPITKVDIMRKRDGTSRGICVVNFEEVEDAKYT